MSIPRAWTIEEVALLLDHSPSTISAMLRDGRLQGYKETIHNGATLPDGRYCRTIRWRISSHAIVAYQDKLEAEARVQVVPRLLFTVRGGTRAERRARATRANAVRWAARAGTPARA